MPKDTFFDYRRPFSSRKKGVLSQGKERDLNKKLLTHPLVIGLWTVLCIFFGIGLIHSGLSIRQVVERKTQAELQLQEEEIRGIQLIQELEESNSSYAKEKIIREELRMQLPGEIILQFSSPSARPQ